MFWLVLERVSTQEVIFGIESHFWYQLTDIRKKQLASTRVGDPFRNVFPVSNPVSEVN